jgi:Ecdysteroid kinase-like family
MLWMAVDLSPKLAALTADWLTDVLREGGHTEAAVSDLIVEPVAFTGATTDMGRLRMTYESGSGATGPASLIAKIRGTKDVQVQMDQAMGLFAREAHFYETYADEVPVSVPRNFYIGDGDTYPLLLEDLATMRIGDQMDGLTVADAERVMDVLGDLHARFWDSRALEQPWLVAPAEGLYAGMIVQLVSSGAPALAERYADRAPDGVLNAVVEMAPRWGEVLSAGAQGPPTLVHNDCRLDNIFFADDGTPCFIDWQILAKTRGTQDVGNLLAGSMNTGDLSANWERLLRRYHDRLLAGGVSGYSFDQCVEHYRQNILYPLGAGMALIGVMDIGDGRGLGDAIIIRCLTHIAELDAFAAI